MRRLAVLSALLLLAGCQPQRPPATAAPTTAPAGIGAAPQGARYDTAVRPVDETRAIRPVQPPQPVLAAPRLSERERQAIAAWEKEEAAGRASALNVAPPPRTRSRLALPGEPGALPRPAVERTATGAPSGRELAIPPAAGDRPGRPQATAMAPTPSRPATPQPVPLPPAPPPPEPPPVQQEAMAPVPAPPAPPVPEAPAASAAPVQAAAAAPVERTLQPPAGPPLTTVIFTPRSANLSDDARIALGVFAQEPGTRRLRRIELWASSSAEDPADAGRIALARALAVHAFLIDHGVKANIEIGGYSEPLGPADRVDVMAR